MSHGSGLPVTVCVRAFILEDTPALLPARSASCPFELPLAPSGVCDG
jgi:hypothetical protein